MQVWDKHLVLIIVLSFLYSLFFSYLSILRLYSFNAHYYDLGIMHQVVYNTYKGHVFEFSNPHLLENTLRSAVHFDLILVPLSIFYFVYPYPETLLVIQSFLLGFSALFIYLIAKEVLGIKQYAVLIAFVYLFYYPVHFINLFDFHGVALAVFFLVSAYYFYLKSEFRLTKTVLILLVLSALTKENIILLVSVFCFYAFLKSKDKSNLIAGLVFLVLFVLVVKIIMPYSARGEFFGGQFYSYSVKDNIDRLFSNQSLNYINDVFSPLLFVPFLSLFNLLPALTEFLKNLLSEKGAMRNLYFHYLSGSLAFLFISFIFGLRQISLLSAIKNKTFMTALIIFILVVNVFLSFNRGPLRNISYSVDYKKYQVVTELAKKYSDYDLKISSSGNLAPFFSGRKYFYDFSFDPADYNKIKNNPDIISNKTGFEHADVVILDKSELSNDLVNLIYRQMLVSGQFKQVFSSNNILVYEKQK
ncbi:MAG: hypothetical protein KatS3mg090_0345 [Patescibacteria group bacterium]|nr:MAG: hypothetical protein KatS3mg090_0345 [Patescibacteria group bacterium]